MTKKRGADFSLDEALRDPGFTPRRGDLDALLQRVVGDDEESARVAAEVVLRIDAPVLAPIVGYVLGAQETPALIELLGRSALRAVEPAEDVRSAISATAGLLVTPRHPKAAASALARIFADASARSRAEGAITGAIGVIAGLASEASLEPSVARAVSRALAAAGTAEARRALDALGTRHDDDKAIARARIAAVRDGARAEATHALLTLDRAAPEPLRAVLACRLGLEPIVKEQLAASGRAARTTRAGRVDIELREAPAFVLGAARSALGISFPLEAVDLVDASPEGVGDAVARALTGAAATAVFAAFDVPPFRFRVSFAGGGKQRAVAWAIAERATAASNGALINDPREAPWEVAVALPPRDEGAALRRGERRPFAQLELRPRFDDRRYPWRKADVPAASHPTVAAAIATLGGARKGDVVWDPFVGSGGELCERARLGDARRFIGTDLSEDALRAARLNTDAAKIHAELVLSDARAFEPGEPVDLIVTNPPMGRRVLRHRGDVENLLASFLGRAARVLSPDGRIVWVSAHPASTREAAAKNGLRLTDAYTIDLGGFDVELQRFSRT